MKRTGFILANYDYMVQPTLEAAVREAKKFGVLDEQKKRNRFVIYEVRRVYANSDVRGLATNLAIAAPPDEAPPVAEPEQIGKRPILRLKRA